MHEYTLIKDMLTVIEAVRREHESRPVKKITVELAEFGTMDEEHFIFHFHELCRGTDLENLKIDFKKVPTGVDARLVDVTLGG